MPQVAYCPLFGLGACYQDTVGAVAEGKTALAGNETRSVVSVSSGIALTAVGRLGVGAMPFLARRLSLLQQVDCAANHPAISQ